MPDGLGALIQQMAIGQDGFTQETRSAKVTNVYLDNIGNVTSCDIRLPGQQRDITNVVNTSGLKLSAGDTVNTNFNRGNRHSIQIISSGNSATSTAAATSTSADIAGGSPPSMPSNSSAPVLLEAGSNDAPNGYVLNAGSNIYFYIVKPSIGSGNTSIPGSFQVNSLVLRLTSLPNPLTTNYLDGTLVTLINSYGVATGIYQLVKSLGQWQSLSGSGTTYFDQLPIESVGSGRIIFTLPRTPIVSFAVSADEGRAHLGSDYTYNASTNQVTMFVPPVNWITFDIC